MRQTEREKDAGACEGYRCHVRVIRVRSGIESLVMQSKIECVRTDSF